jgi:D-beta-D-heptose 7-phosphate kinase / D-beta-D-heptose 1-phosphate adenosyltransferase
VDDTADWLRAGGVNARLSAHPPASQPDAVDLIRRIHAVGGTVVATGGCFDVLHAGHIACLEAARRLGDTLVVLVNSDASVQRLKGADRPVNPVADRRRVLESLRCVDAVVVFGGDDPCELLDQLRPDVWVKGGDYSEEQLPEAPVVNSWGGRVVVVPYLDGRSTSAILDGRNLR